MAKIVAYGVGTTQGYANSTIACDTKTKGTLLRGAGGPFLIREDEDENTKIYLASSADADDIYTTGDSDFAADQVIYVLAQTITGVGTITAGYYTISVDSGAGNAIYFTTNNAEGEPTDPTACPYTFGTDSGANKVTDPEGCDGCNGSGPVINRFEHINTNYGKLDPDQVPFSLQTAGPFSLKFRDAYRVTIGEKKDE